MLYISPFWPQKSGISDYSESLVWGLKKYFDISILTRNVKLTSKAISQSFQILEYEEPYNFDEYDVLLYNFGNSPENHDYMCDMLKMYPGYVILHDFTLYYLMTDYYRRKGELYSKVYQIEGKKKFLYLKQCIKSSGESNLLLHKELAAEMPLNEEILEAAKGVFVHSEYTRQRVIECVPRNKVHRIHIVDCMPDIIYSTEDYLRKKYNWDSETFVIGAVGMVAPSKQNVATCEAVRLYNSKHEKKIKYVMIGEGECADSYLSEDIKKTGFLKQGDFFDAIQSCDVIFNLRYPYNGESSASLVQCMLMGKPCVVSDIGWFGELSDDIVYKVSEKNTLHELEKCIEECLNNNDELQSLALRGKNFVEKNCSADAVAWSIADIVLSV